MNATQSFGASLLATAVIILLGIGLWLVFSDSNENSTAPSQVNAPLATTTSSPSPGDASLQPSMPATEPPSTLARKATDFVNRQADYEVSASPLIVQVGEEYLIAVAATCPPSNGFKCAHAFFFLNERYLGTDTTERYIGEIQIFPGRPSGIEIRYRTYSSADQPCCPSAIGTVTYTWTGSSLRASRSPPMAAGTFTPTPAPVPATSTSAPRSTPVPISTATAAPIPVPTSTIALNAIPVLQSLSFQSATVTRGSQVKLDVVITNTARVNAVFWKQPNGQTTSIGLVQVEKTGIQTTLTFAFPPDAQVGGWQITEIQVTGGGSVTYTFFSASIFTGVSSCPAFQDLGAGMGCTTSLLDVSGNIMVLN